MKTSDLLFSEISTWANPTEIAWINQKNIGDSKSLALAFVMTPRFISKQAIENVTEIIPGWNFRGWSLDRLVRVYFISLLEANSKHESEFHEQLNILFDTAEMNESVALYSALPLLKNPKNWILRATDAVRSNIGIAFDAIAFGNPYPKNHFNELAWNQLVLKCIFNDKPIHLIDGLNERANQVLADTLSDFAHERWAAERRVPSQVWRICVDFINPKLAEDIQQLLKSKSQNDVIAGKLVLKQSNSALLDPLRKQIDLSENMNWALLEKPDPIYTV